MEARIMSVQTAVIDVKGEKKYIIGHIFPDSFHGEKHKLMNPLKMAKDYLDKLSLEKDLHTLSLKDNLPYEIDNDGKLFITSEGEKIYVSEDLKYVNIDGEILNVLFTENKICFGTEHRFDGPFPYKFLYREDKQAYLKREASLRRLANLYDEEEPLKEERGNIIDISDYLKKGR